MIAYQNPQIMYEALNARIKYIRQLNPNLDLRCVNNIAIAILGMDYLFQVAEFNKEFEESEEVKLLKQNLEKYIKSHDDIIHTEDCLEKFMQIFYMLAKNGTLKHGIDYVLKPANRTICIYLKSVYTPFKKQFKQTEDSGVLIPDSKDIQNRAKNKGFKVGQSTNFGATTKRALVIDIGEDEFLNNIFYELERKEEQGHKEDLI